MILFEVKIVDDSYGKLFRIKPFFQGDLLYSKRLDGPCFAFLNKNNEYFHELFSRYHFGEKQTLYDIIHINNNDLQIYYKDDII